MAVVWKIDVFGDYQSNNSEPPPPHLRTISFWRSRPPSPVKRD